MRSSKLLILLFGVFIMICCFTLMGKDQDTGFKKGGNISLGPAVQVGKNGASSVFSFYNTPPESPDGKYLFHLRYKEEPKGSHGKAPGELWVCRRDLTDYRHISDIKAMPAHNGAEAQWIDNDHIALLDSGAIRAINVRNGMDILKKRIETPGISHESFRGKILYTVSKTRGKGASGIYELDCFTGNVRTVKLLSDFRNASLPAYIKTDEVLPVEDWGILHLQYSSDGKK